eukprot:SM000099S25234  [mRNA]  locus=s99:323054:323618:- [translate_table: standard]
MPGFNAAGSLAQVFRMRLAVSFNAPLPTPPCYGRRLWVSAERLFPCSELLRPDVAHSWVLSFPLHRFCVLQYVVLWTLSILFWAGLASPSFLWARFSLSASRAGHAAAKSARSKAAKHADHPAADEFVPLAVDVHGALESHWLDLLARLAWRAVSRRRGEPADFNAAGSWAQ